MAEGSQADNYSDAEKAAISELKDSCFDIINTILARDGIRKSHISMAIANTPSYMSKFLTEQPGFRIDTLARILYHMGYRLDLIAIPIEEDGNEEELDLGDHYEAPRQESPPVHDGGPAPRSAAVHEAVRPDVEHTTLFFP